MSNISREKKNFRTLVLSLKNLNPSWTAPQIATFIEQSNNRSLLKRRQLLTKIRRTLMRNTIDDRSRSGRPVTISTTRFKKEIETSMKLRKGVSIRNVTSNLNRNGMKCSTKTV
jgi:activator of HSP90 ATPase